MDTALLLNRIEKLCADRGITMNTAFLESGVGKNFKSNLKTSEPSKKNLNLLANYFNVSVEYLTGIEDESDVASRAMGEVIEWLTDNDYEVSDNGYDTFTIGKDGTYRHYSSADFATESLGIKATAEEGFELAMLDWENKQFQEPCDLTAQEKTILRLFRSTTEDGRLEMIAAFKAIQKDIEKNITATGQESIG